MKIDESEFGSELNKFEVQVGLGGRLPNRWKTWTLSLEQDVGQEHDDI